MPKSGHTPRPEYPNWLSPGITTWPPPQIESPGVQSATQLASRFPGCWHCPTTHACRAPHLPSLPNTCTEVDTDRQRTGWVNPATGDDAGRGRIQAPDMTGSDLPSAPHCPQRPAPVRIAAERSIRIDTADGVSLEARALFPVGSSRAVVICHPHPLYGGTMHNAMVVVFVKGLGEQKAPEIATLRFNFRGVEGSGGGYDQGRAEVLDVLAALDRVVSELSCARITLLGYSFGAAVALHAAGRHPRVERLALIAPGFRVLNVPIPRRVPQIPIQILVGDRDPLVPIQEAQSLADELGARLHVMQGADHVFVTQRRRVVQTLLTFIAPELGLNETGP